MMLVKIKNNILYKFWKKGNTFIKYKILGGLKMRRELRRHDSNGKNKNKSVLYIAGSLLGIGIISFAITFVLYGNKMEEQTRLGQEKISDLISQSTQNTQSASTQIGKTVEESMNTIETENIVLENNTVNSKEDDKKESTNTKNTKTSTKKNVENDSTNKEKETANISKPVSFVNPVEGEISKEYAKESLVYSETLKEWTTHLGIDIKAEKTTVVKAAESGKIKSIKNDPRYGLSIIIEHSDGYETLYANLLTSEFVQVGEEVKQGQSIGTVGNTAVFEILDEPHLHFEISKDGNEIDPTQYIKYHLYKTCNKNVKLKSLTEDKSNHIIKHLPKN